MHKSKKSKKSKTKLLYENLWKQGVCHTIMALPFTFQKDFKAKENLCKFQIFHHAEM
jgi:hypothetical protein